MSEEARARDVDDVRAKVKVPAAADENGDNGDAADGDASEESKPEPETECAGGKTDAVVLLAR